MDVRYMTGPESVSVPVLNREIKRREVVTVPDDIGKKLLAQGWDEVNPKQTTSSKEKD